MVGFSDFNIIQLLMGEVRGWAGFYGPMVATGFNHGADRPEGYDLDSFLHAVSETKLKWKIRCMPRRWPKVPSPGVLLADA